MTRFAALLILSLATASAHAVKDCGELKAEIAEKIKANKVTSFGLEVVPAAEVGERKVVGSCEGGTKKIVYLRGAERPEI